MKALNKRLKKIFFISFSIQYLYYPKLSQFKKNKHLVIFFFILTHTNIRIETEAILDLSLIILKIRIRILIRFRIENKLIQTF